MLSYQHIYHAGNFADVHKHVILCLLLEQLKHKQKPFGVLDTHAGRGFYDLSAPEAQKTPEFTEGAGRLMAQDALPESLLPWMGEVKKYNPDGELKYYPGSPQICRDLMRPGDSLTLVEKHPQELKALQDRFAETEGVHIHDRDSFEALASLVPLAERRGLVLVDPSYELKHEYSKLPNQLRKAWKKWPTGLYAIWYPVLPREGHLDLLTGLRKTDITNVLVNEIGIRPKGKQGMSGSGMIIINPPFQFDMQLRDMAHHLSGLLAQSGPGYAKTFWLDNVAIDPDTKELDL